MTRSIHEWMLSERYDGKNAYAENGFSAGHIYEGLKLSKCKSFEEQVERVKLYRKWRPKTDKKNMLPTNQAYDLSIYGLSPEDVVERQIEFEVTK